MNCAGVTVPNELHPIENGQLEVEFTPQKSLVHHCEVLFNGKPIPGRYQFRIDRCLLSLSLSLDRSSLLTFRKNM